MTQTQDLDALIAEARDWQSRWDAGWELSRTNVLIGGLLDAITALREENERLREALKRLSFAAQTTGGVAGRDEGLVAAIDNASQALNPDGPEAAAEIERLQRELKRMFLSWQAADYQAGESWAKLKLAREGLDAINADCQPPVHDWVKARIERILKAIGGDE